MSAILAGLATAAKYAPVVKKGFDWLTGGNKPPTRMGSRSGEEKAYMNALQSRMRQGMTGAEINQQLGMASRNIGQATQNQMANVQGTAVRQGLENSGVAAQMQAQVGANQQLGMAQVARDIAARNMAMKRQAEQEFGQMGMRMSDMRYQDALAKRASRDQNLNAVLGAASNIGAGYLNRKQNKQDIEDYINAGMDPKDIPPEILLKMLTGG
tara:strand:+ start:236 stop:871 length:636 start_codon:yes stop_codon:yes gene_type:complete